MGINPIGKSGRPGEFISPTTAAVDAPGPGQSVDSPEEFSLSKVESTEATLKTSPLEQLKSGEISVEEYLDIRVNQAVSHLVDRIPSENLAFIRSTLRTQLEQDPALVDLVRRATSSRIP